jgi:transposase InsO family protein
VIPEEAREKIGACYQKHVGQWGPQVLAFWCRREGLGDWCASTIAEVIAPLRDEPEEKPDPVRYEITASQVMWSEDGAGLRERGRKKELLIAQDEHARFKVNHELVDGPACEDDVVEYLEEAFKRHGPPLVVKHDGDSIFHGEQMRYLLEGYGVLDLTGPRSYPQYNGKKERSIRDVKSYERALRRYGVRGTLQQRIEETIRDLNEVRPRPVLGGRTAREVFTQDRIELPDRQQFRKEVDAAEQRLLARARSRVEERRARRRAIEEVLLRYGLMKEIGDVSHDYGDQNGTF